jgi:hypothetical protein
VPDEYLIIVRSCSQIRVEYYTNGCMMNLFPSFVNLLLTHQNIIEVDEEPPEYLQGLTRMLHMQSGRLEEELEFISKIPSHLVILCHGLQGNTGHMEYLEKRLSEHRKMNRLAILYQIILYYCCYLLALGL